MVTVALLAGIEAAAEEQDDQDEQEQATADGYGPADHQGLPVGRGAAWRAARWPTCRLVRFVEEGQANRS